MKLGRQLSPDGGDSAEVLLQFARSGIDLEALATRLQEEGAASFVTSWKDLLGVIASKTAAASQGAIMTALTLPLKRRAAWKKLQAHFKVIGRRHLRELFAEEPDRGEQLTLEAAGIYLDYSKNRITRATLQLLVELAEESGLRERIDAMFAGEPINVSEQRSVLHVALRAPGDESIRVGGQNVVPAGARGARQDERVSRPSSQRRMARIHRHARSRMSSTSASAAPTSVR